MNPPTVVAGTTSDKLWGSFSSGKEVGAASCWGNFLSSSMLIEAPYSAEGEALLALREIRIQAAPSWDADEVTLTFLFIREDSSEGGKVIAWDQHLEKWLALVPEKGRFKRSGVVTTLEDLTGRDYVDSDPLDLDHLSGP